MNTVKRLVSSVMALTLASSVAAPLAWADEEGSIVDSVKEDMRALDDEPESETLDVDELLAADRAADANVPLNLRKSQPLSLASEPSTSGAWWKLLGSAGIIAGAGFLIQRKLKRSPEATKTPVLDVLSRKSVGVRSEICIVSVDGHRLLLGITPNSIQRLASLPDPDDAMVLAEAEAEPGFGVALRRAFTRSSQEADDIEVASRPTINASDESVPPPESSKPRVIVRDEPTPRAARLAAPLQLELQSLAGAQADSLRALRRRAS